jgi:hypothetical protein
MIENKAKTQGGIIDLNRAQIEQRAAFLALVYDEALKNRTEPDKTARAASRRVGEFYGNSFKNKLPDGSGIAEFSRLMYNGLTLKTYEIESVLVSEEVLEVEYGYCPLVSVWQKLGFSDERINILCDIAMEFDRAIAGVLGYQIEITGTIASGCSRCKIKYSR